MADYSWILGDYNFRVNASLAASMDWVDDKRFVNLLAYDQTGKLELQQHGFKEGVIRFPPTYKIIPQAGNTIQYNNKRVPSWTDRIFVSGEIDLLQYDFIKASGSDHLPIFGLYQFKHELKPVDMSVGEKERCHCY